VNVAQAYAHCEAVTAAQARNFSYGIKLLPGPKRRAMCAIYALARRIDDIGDGDAPGPDKLAALAGVRKDVAALAAADAHRGDDPVLSAVADVSRRFPIPLAAFDDLIDGCEMDVHGTEYGSFEDLVGYCRRVAGSIGRLSLGVYGTDRPEQGEPRADALGVALQITNILRDIVEDRDVLGRVYLPAEDRARFGVAADGRGPTEALMALITFEAARAEEWFERGLTLLPMLDWRSRACTAAMAGIYHRLLGQMQRDPAGVLRGRMSLSGAEKVAVAGRALVRGTV
jgi:phytoene synthase